MKKTLPKILLTLGIAGILLLTVTGCGQKQSAQGLLSDSEIKTLESLYGHNQQAVLEGLGLSENDVQEREKALGCWNIKTPREIMETPFEQVLMYDTTFDENVLYGESFIFSGSEDTKQDEMIQLAVDLVEEAQELYGEPSTYPGMNNRLTVDGVTDALKNGEMISAFEEWNASEYTLLAVSIQRELTAQKETTASWYIEVEYRLNLSDREEWNAIVEEAADA